MWTLPRNGSGAAGSKNGCCARVHVLLDIRSRVCERARMSSPDRPAHVRRPLSTTLAPDVQRALRQRADETGLPIARVLDAAVRTAFRMPDPAMPPELTPTPAP